MSAGQSTSEFQLARLVIIIGAVLEGASVVLHQFQDAGIGTGWVPMALGAAGGLLQIISLLGYTKSRTIVKVAQLQAGPAETPTETP
jgi:hypothetical protein